jgi:hypothetical protein
MKNVMRKIVLAVCLMFGCAAFVNAQERDRSTTAQEQEGQPISISELPESVKASLESQDYSGWTAGSAYKKTDASSNKEMYVVELKRGTETKKVKFDSEGNKLDKKDKKPKQEDLE